MIKKILSVLLISAMLFSAVGCGKKETSSKDNTNDSAKETQMDTVDKKEEKEDKKLEVLGDTMKYDPNKEVNDGQPITIDFWTWDFVDIYQNLIDQYQEIHPNVTINLIETPWSDYWTKLPLSLNSKDSPAVFAIHNSYHDNLINYMAPYDIPLEELEADFLNVDSHLIDGNIYYMDYAMMTANLYYNKDMWQAAGLTEADFPKTWADVAEVAKKLTIKEGDQLVQAGFNYNGTFNQMVLGLNYQLDQNLFNEDGTATMNNEAMNKVVQYFVDLYRKDGVGSPDFGTSAGESFGQGQSAMIVMWGYYYNQLINDYPDVKFGILEVPKFSEDEDIYAYNRYNGESSLGISKNVSAEAQAVAQDFVRFSLANDEFLVNYSVRANCFPTKLSLANRPEILEHPVLSALAPNIDRYIWPGTMPSTVEDNMKIAGENILYNGMSVSDALAQAEATINSDLSNIDFVPVENMYKYAK
ncbi:MAG: extracellular solute-binding protein [Lachnospiraceae bacterium]|jgi:multiple sugar transport system substrate-binding protein|nr:extracellular solute-binding protein [Lachnospiraceae bacterium]